MPVSLDKIDYEIFRCLLEDGRASYSTIAKRVNLTDVAIKKRLQSLTKRNIIKSITPQLNLEVLGYENPIFVQIRSDASKTKDVLRRLETFDYVVEVYKTLGEFNLLVKIVLPKLGLADDFISKISTIDGINDVKTLVVLDKVKNSECLPASLLQKKL